MTAEDVGGVPGGGVLRGWLQPAVNDDGSLNIVPRNFGTLAWSFDLAGSPNNGTVTNGTIFLARVDVLGTATVTKLRVVLGTAATTPTAGQNWIALLDANGNVLQSVGIDSASASAGLLETTIPATPVTAGIYYVAILLNAATPATIARGSTVSVGALNAGLSAAQSRWATNGTGQTTITNRTMSSNSNAGLIPFWAAIA